MVVGLQAIFSFSPERLEIVSYGETGTPVHHIVKNMPGFYYPSFSSRCKREDIDWAYRNPSPSKKGRKDEEKMHIKTEEQMAVDL